MLKLSLADAQNDPRELIFGNSHKFVSVFSAFGLGLFLALYAQTQIALLLWVALMFVTGVCIGALPVSDRFVAVQIDSESISQPSVQAVAANSHTASSCGVVYVMRRSDGVLKIGRTRNLRERLRRHRADYGTTFDVVTAWVVPDAEGYEYHALNATGKYAYSEGGRKELRRMSETELNQFVLDFTERVYRGFKKTA